VPGPGGHLALGREFLFATMAPGRLAAVRRGENRAAALFAVGREPAAVAFDGESAWVANYESDTVSRISLAAAAAVR
jgi:hypothetical protein